MRKVLPGVNVIIAASRHNGNECHCAYSNDSRHHNSTPKRTPVTNTYIKMYEHVMLSDVASSIHNCTLSNNERHPNCKEHTHTHSTRDRYATGDRHHCHSISSHSATNQLCFLERQRHAATSASPMTVTRPPIYKSGSCRISRRHCHSARRKARPS